MPYLWRLKDYKDGAPWKSWDKDIRFRKQQAIVKYSSLLKDEIDFYMFIQFIFILSGKTLRFYANNKGIRNNRGYSNICSRR